MIAGLPRLAAALLPTQRTQVIVVAEGAQGHRPMGAPFTDELAAAQFADEVNATLQITPAERTELLIRSIFPAARPRPTDLRQARPLVDDVLRRS